MAAIRRWSRCWSGAAWSATAGARPDPRARRAPPGGVRRPAAPVQRAPAAPAWGPPAAACKTLCGRQAAAPLPYPPAGRRCRRAGRRDPARSPPARAGVPVPVPRCSLPAPRALPARPGPARHRPRSPSGRACRGAVRCQFTQCRRGEILHETVGQSLECQRGGQAEKAAFRLEVQVERHPAAAVPIGCEAPFAIQAAQWTLEELHAHQLRGFQAVAGGETESHATGAHVQPGGDAVRLPLQDFHALAPREQLRIALHLVDQGKQGGRWAGNQGLAADHGHARPLPGASAPAPSSTIRATMRDSIENAIVSTRPHILMSSKKNTSGGKASQQSATIGLNKRARHEYFIEERIEAGIALEGWEVKSLRAGRLNFADSYALIRDGELFLFGAQITPLNTASTHVVADPRRTRKLLLHRREID